jgi:sigma-B regulation protein RsbU (phosphoserine phosphatase)
MWNIKSTIQMMRALSLSANSDELAQVVVNHMRHTTSVDRVLITSQCDPGTLKYHVARCIDWDSQQNRFVESQPNDIRQGGLLAELLYAGELRLIADLSIAPGEPAFDLLCGHKTLMAFPLFDKGYAAGAVILLSTEPRACKPSELCQLAVISGLFDRAYQTHFLVRQLETTCRALDRELAAAADVQRWLLPSAVPAVPGVSIAASYQAAKRSGGDYYDMMKLPDGRLGLLIVDVSGKGAPAAVLMAVIRTIVHLQESYWSRPASLLGEINRNLCGLDLINHGSFATAFCAVLDAGNGQLVYSSAGHNPPRLIKACQTQLLNLDEAQSLPLGVEMNTRYSEASNYLSSLDTLVLYTDGIVDACSAKGELFGIERLDRILRDLPSACSAQQTIQATLTAVEGFSEAAAQSDDRTLVAIKMEGCGKPGKITGNGKLKRSRRDNLPILGPRARTC